MKSPEELEEIVPLEAQNQQLNDDENLEEDVLSLLSQEQPQLKKPFNSDISKSIPERVLDKIAAYLDEVTKQDIKTRQPWLDIINKVKPYLGFGIEEDATVLGNQTPFTEDAAQIKTFDTTFSTALLRLWSLLRAELLPTNGPVGFETNVDNSEMYEIRGEIVKDSLNEYLTVKDKGFYPDYDRFLIYLLLYGCIFRKVYICPTTKEPVSRFIIPEDFLVDNNCSSILESNRLTHIRHLSKREIILNIQNGIFRKVDLIYLKNAISNSDTLINSDDDSNKNNLNKEAIASRFKFYETHEYLDLKEFFADDTSNIADIVLSDLPSPYVITRCAYTNKIVSIVPNWNKDDPSKERINCFIHYNLFPGFNIYGLGLAQILGSNAISLTKMQKMAIDAAIFQNFPGGIRAPGLKNQDFNPTITPGQFIALDTGSTPLQQAVMPLPYNGPSPALLELSQRVIAQTQQLAGTTEVSLSENSENTPVGTTLAALEVNNRLQSAILRTIHASFSEEIQLIYKAFGFANDEEQIKIIPVSNPSVESSTQRIMKAESLLKIASGAPEMHNMEEIYKRVYTALGISNIEGIFRNEEQQMPQAPQPLDPLAVEMADIEQRRLEVESKERIAHLNIEGDGFKTQMNFEMDKAKLELNKYITDLKAMQDMSATEIKSELELLKIESQNNIDKLKVEIESLKEQLNLKNQEAVYEQRN